ncbi:unnamed protein product [Peronospora belbahrii]|uniref:Uncharacterized protein n=1 Tax=Peronospora belbahrii TaxID=622444 RepID=A0AAU9KZT4_9STRA|nr:unnamed protein product [Peronospora belbahrii]
MVVTEPPLLAEGMSSSSVSDVPVSRIGSRRSPHRDIDVASPPCTVAEITSLSALPWKDFIRALNAGDIKQICIVPIAVSITEEIL